MFNIYVTKDVYEDNYKDGQIGNMYTVIYNSKIADTNNFQYIINKITTYLDCEEKDIQLNIENNVYEFSQIENEYGDKANNLEINKWKNNEFKLFSAYYTFTITEENEVNLNNKGN